MASILKVGRIPEQVYRLFSFFKPSYYWPLKMLLASTIYKRLSQVSGPYGT